MNVYCWIKNNTLIFPPLSNTLIGVICKPIYRYILENCLSQMLFRLFKAYSHYFSIAVDFITTTITALSLRRGVIMIKDENAKKPYLVR